MPPDTVKVDRSSRFGNPFQVSEVGSRAEAVRRFRDFLALPEQAELVADIRRTLRGKNLACWCSLTGPCHADVLIEVANGADGTL